MKLTSFGFIEARMLFVAVGALFCCLFYLLAAKLFRKATGVLALALLFLLPPDPRIHFDLLGAQLMGETMMLLFIVAGYLMLLPAARYPLLGALSSILFGAAILAKLQSLPFLYCSFFVMLALAIWSRHWKFCTAISLTFTAYYSCNRLADILFKIIYQHVPKGVFTPYEDTSGLAKLLGFWPSLDFRMVAVEYLANWCWPFIAGLGCFLVITVRKWNPTRLSGEQIVIAGILTLTIAWLIWFTLLGATFYRYVFPPIVLSTLFLADCLTGPGAELRYRRVLDAAARTFSSKDLRSAAMLALLVVATFWATRSVYLLTTGLLLSSNEHLEQTVRYIDEHIPQEALIETYDSQIIALSRRRFHFPPAHVHVEMISLLDSPQAVYEKYDWKAANPDFVVVGPWSRDVWRFYREVESSPAWSTVAQFGGFVIYKRKP